MCELVCIKCDSCACLCAEEAHSEEENKVLEAFRGFLWKDDIDHLVDYVEKLAVAEEHVTSDCQQFFRDCCTQICEGDPTRETLAFIQTVSTKVTPESTWGLLRRIAMWIPAGGAWCAVGSPEYHNHSLAPVQETVSRYRVFALSPIARSGQRMPSKRSRATQHTSHTSHCGRMQERGTMRTLQVWASVLSQSISHSS